MRCASCGSWIVSDHGEPWTKLCDACTDLDARAHKLGARVREAALREMEEDRDALAKRITRENREATAPRVAARRQKRRAK